MKQFNQFDISDVFDEMNAPLFIIESEEILFFNKFFKENFHEIPFDWKCSIVEEEVAAAIDDFFKTGLVPKNSFLKKIRPKEQNVGKYEWTFTNLPSSYSEKFLIVMGHEMHFYPRGEEKLERSRDELLQSEEKYRILVEESTELIFSLSDTLVFYYISPNVKQFLGYESEEVIGTSFLNYLNPEDLDVFQAIDADISEFLDENQHLEFRIRHKNGTFRVLSSNGRMVYGYDDKQPFYTGVARDITELKQAQKDLFHAKERAEKASFEKSQFLSVMSHEIRTPMNAVIGLAHLLMEENPREDQLENLKTLKFSAENLMSLINNILDFNKIEAGKIELEMSPFDLRVLVHRIVHSYSFQAKEKGLKIRAEIDGEIPEMLIGDSVRISQIINNLLSNAVKFTDKGQVKTALQLLKADRETCEIQFYIEDTGIGIPEEKIDFIFEAFTQASLDTTRKFGGTGLGLAIVKRLVELHGSEISVNTSLNKGSTFEFILKFNIVEIKNNEHSQQQDYKDKSLQNASILVAEDNLINQILIKKFLKNWHVGKLVIASDGQEAIEEFQKTDFDIILLDLQMPILDGFSVAKIIREDSTSPKSQIPILVFSAASPQDIKSEMKQLNISGFIEKPFTPEGLFGKISEQLNSKDLS